MSAGEIDCREGFVRPLLEGYHHLNSTDIVIRKHVDRTVTAYITALQSMITTIICMTNIM